MFRQFLCEKSQRHRRTACFARVFHVFTGFYYKSVNFAPSSQIESEIEPLIRFTDEFCTFLLDLKNLFRSTTSGKHPPCACHKRLKVKYWIIDYKQMWKKSDFYDVIVIWKTFIVILTWWNKIAIFWRSGQRLNFFVFLANFLTLNAIFRHVGVSLSPENILQLCVINHSSSF